MSSWLTGPVHDWEWPGMIDVTLVCEHCKTEFKWRTRSLNSTRNKPKFCRFHKTAASRKGTLC